MASDKARFYLEQYVPELQEYQQKEIFSRDEIASITSKRSDFEHILNARGSTPGDYARYATYEMNLDSLRKKRCKRLGVKSTAFNGQRTVFFVLGRATKKFPGDMGLWMQYINFCRKEKATKKLTKVFTSVLRLHPRDYSLWILAAKYYSETQGDMGTARSYMQRGLRFCKDEPRMYLEYAKLEMVYLAKLSARKKILGLDEPSSTNKASDDENFTLLPTITAADIDPDAGRGVEEVNEEAIKRLENAPAFSGAIPIAIFDAAMKQFAKTGAEVAEDFYDLIASMSSVPASLRILQHILDHLNSEAPVSPEAILCAALFKMFGIDPQSAEFPAALGTSLVAIKKRSGDLGEKQQVRLAQKVVLLLLGLLNVVEDEDVRKVVRATFKRYLRIIVEAPAKPARKSELDMLLTRLQKEGRDVESDIVSALVEEARLS